MNAAHMVAVGGLLVISLFGLWLLFAIGQAASETRRRRRVASALDEVYRNAQNRSQHDELAIWRERRMIELDGAKRRHPTGRDML